MARKKTLGEGDKGDRGVWNIQLKKKKKMYGKLGR